ncbi:glycine cleavage system aminomethyltransferase GcvT [Sphingomicrobium astaxanthinifaciens]|uniref:glycine cleavage system aminomethyltransferase GcvT n=1 Tax=Sphingomicrobium astaxanthinifaciens TaxID=1227949 RepID=UPI001FCB3D7C|nr:glycine cleavage system aminomethyltransferase GcvT [Sphingomicrobium astaxanthinifaciens]MCJ7422076.1 glycine cleavage system aminomethyltransferase GcvT [Sphingomicrobium astaxanthinifaciens]
MTDTLPLDRWHVAHGARMVEFAGYAMPIQYEGIIAEHKWTREQAGLFDVSHMGQLTVKGPGAAAALEALMPGDFAGLKPGRARYSMLLADDGGILDDLIVTRVPDADSDEAFALVVNGAVKHDDIAHLRARLPEEVEMTHHEERALLALQGPAAAAVLERLVPGVADLAFMQGAGFDHEGDFLWISRSGYTGEDGFEISIAPAQVEAFAEALVADGRVKPIGLGARDSLRLEAGLPLYGHDLDPEITPIMADLGFAISKRRREEGGFPGAERILEERAKGALVKRVGFFVEGRQPVREGAPLLDGEGNVVGKITSGGFSPTLERPIAMGYLATHLVDDADAVVKAQQRSKLFDVTVTDMPFVPHNYHRKQGKK